MRRATERWTAAAGAVLLSLALAGCKDDLSDTAGGAALAASAPEVSPKRVPPPPQLVAVAAPASAAEGGDLAEVRAQLESTLTKASSCSADTQCRSVATGAKACGGPTGYRAYSTSGADGAKVEALAQRERELGAAAARASHEVSPCFMLADPGAHCQQGKCVTGPPGAP